uniref:wall-associated receptor kinase 2-like n=1 Tax=Erigeron canadensis TaxID=72917 RepID=UPI001CB964DB|nr:wall-associated receptor kinase 2-like [Erigeron canadensis]
MVPERCGGGGGGGGGGDGDVLVSAVVTGGGGDRHGWQLCRCINASYLKPNCPAVDKCGNVTIDYPFSIVDDCYADESYYIQCDPVTQIPRLNISSLIVVPGILKNGSNDHLEVLDITLDGHLTVALPAGYVCYDEHGTETSYSVTSVNTFRFPISNTQNNFVVVGCDIEAYIYLEESITHTSCRTNCDQGIKNGSCQGSGCCMASIPQVTTAAFGASDYRNHSKVSDYSKCGHAFIVEHTKYNFSVGDLNTMRNDISFPVVLEWFAGDTYCEEAIKDNTTYMCRGKSGCQDRDRESGFPGYRCICSDGYSGNPYLYDGCQDINECESSELNKCPSGYKCKNTDGSYDCLCPKGLQGDAKSGEVCTKPANEPDNASVTKGKAVAGFFGVAGATIIMALTYCGIKKRKIIKGREDFFKQNGEIMLEKVLFARKDHVNNNAIIFTYEELKKATDNFNETNIIGQGGYGVVYKAILTNKTSVAIKKSKVIDESQIKQFMNEVIILSQINHPNVVKLLGCCLETQVPLLVYEYITNNTLCHHIKEAMMTFETRIKIAAETAEALSYINSTTQIIHRDVKPSNILLNDDFSAKVSDFGISRFVPLGQSYLSTHVKGTGGYVDPEYFYTGKLNEKSDVYSFGVVLVELLTGTKIHSLEISLNVYRGAAAYLSSLLERNALFKVLDKQLKSEEYADVVKDVAKLAIKCLDLEGRNRPRMKEVKTELEQLQLRCVLSSTG